jgi:hypothetical protein
LVSGAPRCRHKIETTGKMTDKSVRCRPGRIDVRRGRTHIRTREYDISCGGLVLVHRSRKGMRLGQPVVAQAHRISVRTSPPRRAPQKGDTLNV